MGAMIVLWCGFVELLNSSGIIIEMIGILLYVVLCYCFLVLIAPTVYQQVATIHVSRIQYNTGIYEDSRRI